MSFQISKVLIYGHNKKVRILPFKLGKVNIVTGASKTGKSALIHIVSYCFGSKSTIPEGVILENTSWFAIQIEKEKESFFIARKSPGPGNPGSPDIYIEKGHNLEVPSFENLAKNADVESINVLLSEFAGIAAYAFEPKEGQTRNAGAADISKALIYCFQEQSEVASQKFLFHRQGEPFLPQSIKDYFPFFLGVVDRNYISQKDELRKLKSELKRLEAKKAENERLKGYAFERPHALMQEAISVGLLLPTQNIPQSWEEIKKILGSAVNARPETDPSEGNSEQMLDSLFDEQKSLREQYRSLGDEISALKSLKASGDGFKNEAMEQRSRLNSIGLFKTDGELDYNSCPVCSSKLNIPIPTVEAIKQNLGKASQQLQSVTADAPHIERLIYDTQAKQSQISSQLHSIKLKIESIQQTEKQIEVFRDANAKRALVQGRIGFYMESIADVTDTVSDNIETEQIKQKIKELEELTKEEEIQSKLQSVLSNLSQEMTAMARRLDLEHAKYPIRLDPKKLTVVADTEAGPLPLERMGSGETWVSLHLITYLVLHRWFIKRNIPVPNFIFFDQPTQAYFPPDSTDETVKNTDRESVVKMFQLIKQSAEEYGIQVVIMEHADIQQAWFQEMIAEKWWDGQTKLVPVKWLNSEG